VDRLQEVVVKIANTAVQFASTHQLIAQENRRESLQAWIGARPTGQPRPTERSGGTSLNIARSETFDYDEVTVGRAAYTSGLANLATRLGGATPQGRQSIGATGAANPAVPAMRSAASDENDAQLSLTPEQSMLIQLLEKLFGVKVHLSTPASAASRSCTSAPTTSVTPTGDPAPPPPRQGWGVDYQASVSYRESEQTTFSAGGVVRTSNGEDIAFKVELTMARSFATEQTVRIAGGDAAIDPLVVNYAGTAASLAGAHFEFDLDSDGEKEHLAAPANGSGFLALDRNGDGTINNGGELFGPASGDGFSDLATLDLDRNQWIDENDPSFERLRIWSPGVGSGAGSLASLKDRGIGALYLGQEATPFALKDQQNQLEAQVVASSVFLREDGSAGTVQQLNLVA
jgi:hypothetical protein